MNTSIRHPRLASAALRRQVAIVASVIGALLTQSAASLANEVVDLRRQPVIEGNAEAALEKNAVCGGCHGVDGNSVVPDFPSLAGQSATYLYLQLKAFKTGSRPSDIMKPQVEALSDQDMKDLAAHYASLSPKASSPAASDGAADAGKNLYVRGDPMRGIPACQGCHGVRCAFGGAGPRSAGDALAHLSIARRSTSKLRCRAVEGVSSWHESRLEQWPHHANRRASARRGVDAADCRLCESVAASVSRSKMSRCRSLTQAA
jgi:cytochrome c553